MHSTNIKIKIIGAQQARFHNIYKNINPYPANVEFRVSS